MTMSSSYYNDENNRLVAVESRDTKASDQFVYADKQTGIYCRPDCSLSSVPPRSCIALFDGYKQAESCGLRACTNCRPNVNIEIGTEIVDSTVSAVNASLGLELSSSHEDQQQHDQQKIEQQHPGFQQSFGLNNDYNALGLMGGVNGGGGIGLHQRSNSTVSSPVIPDGEEGWRPRRASIASGHIPVASAAVQEYSRVNDYHNNINIGNMNMAKRENARSESATGDHARLVDEACKHIAKETLKIFIQATKEHNEALSSDNSQEDGAGSHPNSNSNSQSHRRSSSASSAPNNGKVVKLQRKKRRGGILGFKELAAKAGLSPWHFHRVFKSCCGVTPKVWGDLAWDLISSNHPMQSPNVVGTVAPGSDQLPTPRSTTSDHHHQYNHHLHQPQTVTTQAYFLPSNNVPTTLTTTYDHNQSLPTPTTSISTPVDGLSSASSSSSSSSRAQFAAAAAAAAQNMQTWAPNDDNSPSAEQLLAQQQPPTLAMNPDPVVTSTDSFNELLGTESTDDLMGTSTTATIEPVLTTSLEIGGLTTVAEDNNQNNWLIETPSAVTGDPMLKDSLFSTFATATSSANSMPPLAVAASTSTPDWVDNCGT